MKRRDKIVLGVAIALLVLILGFSVGIMKVPAVKQYLQTASAKWEAEMHKPENAAIGAALLIVAQTGIVMVCGPATPLNLVTGVIFDSLTQALVVANIAVILPALITFLVARYSCYNMLIGWYADNKKFKTLADAIARGGVKIVCLFRLSPLFPFGVCNYLMGLTEVTYLDYCIGTIVGLVPFTSVYAYVGHVAKSAIFTGQTPKEEYFVLLIGLICTIAIVFWAKRELDRFTPPEEYSVVSAVDDEEDGAINEAPSDSITVTTIPKAESLYQNNAA